MASLRRAGEDKETADGDRRKTAFMKKEYPLGAKDLYAGFMLRCLDFNTPLGVAGLITMQSWMFLSTYEKLRKALIGNNHLITMAHLGTNAFDSIGGEVVSTTAFILENSPESHCTELVGRHTSYIRLVEFRSAREKNIRLKEAARPSQQIDWRYDPGSQSSETIPGSPLALWLSEKVLDCFLHGKPMGELVEARNGFTTGDNDRFLRFWWEISLLAASLPEGIDKNDSSSVYPPSGVDEDSKNRKWVPYNKGGAFRKWYGNHEYVINWENDGEELRSFERSVLRNLKNQFSPSVSWSKVSSGQPAFRIYPAGFIFDVAGTSVFPVDRKLRLSFLAAVLNSSVALKFLSAIAPTLNFEVGQVGAIPIIPDKEAKLTEIEGIGINAVRNSEVDHQAQETSWDFEVNPLVRIRDSN